MEKYHSEILRKEKGVGGGSIFIDETMSEQNHIRVREKNRRLDVAERRANGESTE